MDENIHPEPIPAAFDDIADDNTVDEDPTADNDNDAMLL